MVFVKKKQMKLMQDFLKIKHKKKLGQFMRREDFETIAYRIHHVFVEESAAEPGR